MSLINQFGKRLNIGVLLMLSLNGCTTGDRDSDSGKRMYEELCRTKARETIYRTVEGAEGLFIGKLYFDDYDGDQLGNRLLEDPYGYSIFETDWRGNKYTKLFRYVEFPNFQFSDYPNAKFIHREMRPTGEMRANANQRFRL